MRYGDMELRLINRSDGLCEAFDDETLEVLKKMGMKYFVVEYKRTRDYTNHKRWFCYVNHTFNMQDCYSDKEVWRGILQIYGGHCRTVVDSTGKTHIWPESISWKNFDDEEQFKSMFRRSIKGFIRNHGNGITEDELLRIIDFEPFR
jgi:hypothetical protein